MGKRVLLTVLVFVMIITVILLSACVDVLEIKTDDNTSYSLINPNNYNPKVTVPVGNEYSSPDAGTSTPDTSKEAGVTTQPEETLEVTAQPEETLEVTEQPEETLEVTEQPSATPSPTPYPINTPKAPATPTPTPSPYPILRIPGSVDAYSLSTEFPAIIPRSFNLDEAGNFSFTRSQAYSAGDKSLVLIGPKGTRDRNAPVKSFIVDMTFRGVAENKNGKLYLVPSAVDLKIRFGSEYDRECYIRSIDKQEAANGTAGLYANSRELFETGSTTVDMTPNSTYVAGVINPVLIREIVLNITRDGYLIDSIYYIPNFSESQTQAIAKYKGRDTYIYDGGQLVKHTQVKGTGTYERFFENGTIKREVAEEYNNLSQKVVTETFFRNPSIKELVTKQTYSNEDDLPHRFERWEYDEYENLLHYTLHTNETLNEEVINEWTKKPVTGFYKTYGYEWTKYDADERISEERRNQDGKLIYQCRKEFPYGKLIERVYTEEGTPVKILTYTPNVYRTGGEGTVRYYKGDGSYEIVEEKPLYFDFETRTWYEGEAE